MANEEVATQPEFSPTTLSSIFEDAAGLDTPSEVSEQVQSEGGGSEEGAPAEGQESSEATLTEASKPEAESDKTGEKEADPSPGSGEDKTVVPLAAMLAERDKAKALQAELEAIKAAGSVGDSPTEQAKVDTSDIPSIYEGEDKFVEALSRKVQETTRQEIFKDRLRTSQKVAIDQFGAEKLQAALDKLTPEMAKSPQLQERFKQADQPFVEAMKMAEEMEKAEQVNDPEFVQKWTEEKEKEIEARIRAELAGELDAEADLDKAIPDSLSGTRSSGDLKGGQNYKGPKPLSSILEL